MKTKREKHHGKQSVSEQDTFGQQAGSLKDQSMKKKIQIS